MSHRKPLPNKRKGVRQKCYIDGTKMFVSTGEYEDGSLGEIFIDMYKTGTSYKGILGCFSILFSLALQYGVPLEKLVSIFKFTRFPPNGLVTGCQHIKKASSPVDYMVRLVGYLYLNDSSLVEVPKKGDEN